MKLKKCVNAGCEKNKKKTLHSPYTLKSICPKCKEKTSEAHYKFIKVRGKLEKTEK